MSTHTPQAPLPKVENMRVAIVKAMWNGHITDRLTASALEVFRLQNFPERDVVVFDVPGAVELTYAASQIIETGLFDAVIVFGCVIKGDTPHFDYVCQCVTQGIAMLNSDCDIPVIFGVLTVNDEQQALDRCGGCCGDKGAEAAEAAIRMHDFTVKVRDL